MVHNPAFSPEQNVNPVIAVAHPGLRDVADAHKQRRLIRPDRPVTYAAPIKGQYGATAPLTDRMARLDVPGNLALPIRPQTFFDKTSCKMCLSKLRSATSRFSWRFSSSSCLSRRSSLTPNPPYSCLPPVKGLLRYPHPADHLRHRRARLCLLHRVGNLLLSLSTLLHGMLL